MLEIRINEERTIVENTIMKCQWTLNTSDFFGDVYSILENNFPGISPESVEQHTRTYLVNKLNEHPVAPPATIFGCNELGATLLTLIDYIEDNTKHDIGTDRSYIFPTLKDLEEYRIINRMRSNYLPDSFDDNNGIHFSGLATVTQVLISALYFYAYHDYKLARCQHCGKWFATKNLKKKYCDRVSPCFGTIVKGKTPLSCEQAVRNILQKCSRKKNRITTKMNQRSAIKYPDSTYEDTFNADCSRLYNLAKLEPTTENLTKYHNFLETSEKERGWINNG